MRTIRSVSLRRSMRLAAAQTQKNRLDVLPAGCTTGSVRIRCPDCDPYVVAAFVLSLGLRRSLAPRSVTQTLAISPSVLQPTSVSGLTGPSYLTVLCLSGYPNKEELATFVRIREKTRTGRARIRQVSSDWANVRREQVIAHYAVRPTRGLRHTEWNRYNAVANRASSRVAADCAAGSEANRSQ
jgi:hypothetical protein